MKAKSWKDAFEAAGLIAIVASLVFVGFQLQQDRVIARSELTSESFQMIHSIQRTLTDSEFVKIYSKMLEQPEDLSFEEKVQIDNLFRQVAGTYFRECYLKGQGIMAECDGIIRATAWMFFGSRYGQSWWRLNGPKGDESNELFPFPNWVEAEIENYDSNLYRQMIKDTNAEN